MREKREPREQKTVQLQKIETTPPMNNKGWKQASPFIKIGKTKQVLGKTV